MSIFRSVDMHFYKFTCFKDNAWKVMNELGKLGNLDFIDLNKKEQPFNLPYGNTLKRCEEVLRNLMIVMSQTDVNLRKPQTTEEFQEIIGHLEKKMGKTASSFFDHIETRVKELAQFTNESQETYEQIKQSYISLILMREVLKMVREQYKDARANERAFDEESKDSKKERLLGDDHGSPFGSISTTNIAGVIDKHEVVKLRRFLFRVTRGKAMCITRDIDPKLLKDEGIRTPKAMYLIIFQSGDFINEKIKNICDSFLGESVELPSKEKFNDKISDISYKITTSKEVLEKTNAQRKKYYEIENRISPNSTISLFKTYEMYIKKEILIYQTLNKLVPENQLLHGFFWTNMDKKETNDKFHTIQNEFRFEGLQAFEMTQDVVIKPPTKIESNEFLESFQSIVNTYGVPEYKEVNPAYFTIVTFPFLFGVMFGDVAHGVLLFAFASYLTYFREQLEQSNSIFKALLGARYLLLMMGFFATFCGLLYNDMMAIPIEGFGGSCYKDTENRPMPGCVYPFGIDPRWYRSKSAITFVNSLKMKLSVIIAISHMALGVFMKAFNAVYFKSYIDFFFEFVPQIILMLSLFGYMDLMIIIKWLTDYTNKESLAPSIINTMINIPLKGAYIEGQPFISNMETNQKISLTLLLIAVICIPIMLIIKPYILISRLPKHDEKEQPENKVVHEDEEEKNYEKLDDQQSEESDHFDVPRQKKGTGTNLKPSEEKAKDAKLVAPTNKVNELPDSKDIDESLEFNKKSEMLNEVSGEGHSASEIFIHQLIETIEFVLGTISNTASYLRLWALSLAHSQLAGVFFELLLWGGIKAENPIAIFIGFLVFGSATFAVLM